MWIRLSFLVILAIGPGVMAGQTMDNKTMAEILDSVTDSLDGMAGFWQLTYNDRMMLVITDESHDRMRIISPIAVMDDVSDEEVELAMAANFHSTLDVRYAISDEIMWAAFIHPLSALSEGQVRDALLQVYRAAETFGGSYSSSELVFPGRAGNSPPLKKKM